MSTRGAWGRTLSLCECKGSDTEFDTVQDGPPAGVQVKKR